MPAPIMIDPTEKRNAVVGMMNGLSYEQLEKVEHFIASMSMSGGK